MSSKWASAVKKAMVPRAQESVIACISKPPGERRTTEIEMIIPWFRKKSELLRSIDRGVLTEIIRGCEYKRAIYNEVVIKQGDVGDCFYIMLTGRTSVYIDTVKSDDDPNPNETTDSERDKLAGAMSLIAGIAKAKLRTVKDRATLGKFIIHFDAGKSFGEIALMSEDSVRNASIVADEDTDLLIVHRDLFNSTLKAKQEEEYQERKDFIDSSPLFRNWNAKFKRLLEMSVRKETLPFDTHIVTQGQPVIGLHFIIKGHAKVTVEPDKHRRQFPRLFDDVNIYDLQKSTKVSGTNGKTPMEHVCTQNQIRIRRTDGYAAAERRLAHRKVHLCSVEENEVLGDTEMAFDLPTYLQTVTCTSNTEVLILDVKNYERLITKKNPQTIDLMRSAIEAKLKQKLNSSNGAQVDLFKNVLRKIESTKPKKTTQGVPETANLVDKDDMYSQLIELYLDDKVSTLVDPLVPNSVFYRYKTIQKRKAKEAWEKRMHNSKQEEQRRQPTKTKRKARSRRELQSITIGPPPKLYQNRPQTAPPRVTHRQRSGILKDTDGNNNSKTFITEAPDAIKNDVVENAAADTTSQNQNERRGSLKFIQNGHHVTTTRAYEEEEEEYFDNETSNGVLRNLEGRLQAFYEKCSERERRQSSGRVAELRRFEVQNVVGGAPVPGGTVYVKRKPCKYSTRLPRSSVGDDVQGSHEHVRRFMLPKNTLSSTLFAGADTNGDSRQFMSRVSVHELNSCVLDRFGGASSDDERETTWQEPSAIEKQTTTARRRLRPSTAGARLIST